MLFNTGDKVHVLVRRNFDGDVRRHLIGMVERSSEHAILVQGRKAVYDNSSANYDILSEINSQVVSLVDSGVIITHIPEHVKLDELYYQYNPGMTVITDGKEWTLRITEVGLGG